jgi:hypothetical protein
MTETPEEVREKVHQAELAKGSDPRVAEGRAKAAEMRARQGLPTDPQEAWKAKLAGEGKTPAPPTEEPAAPTPAAEAAEEPTAAAEPLAPAAEPPAEEATPQAEEKAPPPPEAAITAQPESPIQPEPTFDPEVGQIIELDLEGLKEIAGIKLRERHPAPWLVLTLLAIVASAAFYLIAFNTTPTQSPTPCHTQPPHTLICPQPPP